METRYPRQALMAARLVWVAFAMATVVYIAVAHFLVQGKEPSWEGNAQYSLMRTIFAVLAVVEVIFQQVIHTVGFAPQIAKASDPRERAGRATGAMIVRTACLEVIGIFGLILAILFGRFLDAVIFGVASLALMPLTFPVASHYLPPTGSDGPWHGKADR